MYDPYREPRSRPVWPVVLMAGVVVMVVVVLVLYFLDVDGYFGSTTNGRPTGVFYFGIFPLFLVLILVMFAVRMVFWSRVWGSRQGYARPHPGRDPAVMTVRQRYARGEITREQYDQLMTELGRRRTGP